MLVRDVMTPDPVTIGPNHSIGTALARMRRGGFRRLPVVEDGKLIGIITDRDLRLAMNSPYVLREGWYDSYLMEHIEVRSCMTPNPVTLTPDHSLVEAVRIMEAQKFGGIPVVENGKLVGIVTETDLMKVLIQLLLEHEGVETAPR
ncbi:MAG: CBS domain-containing protein [Chloroflexi bacterium]|nr:MAG: CBS domain-containing protein [Chloroflexota bacterium]